MYYGNRLNGTLEYSKDPDKLVHDVALFANIKPFFRNLIT